MVKIPDPLRHTGLMDLAPANHLRWETEHVGHMMPVGAGIMDGWGMRRRQRGRVLVG